MIETARLIVDPPALGAWNMAVDHALLESANETGSITLRLYQWSEPTLSLGYFQRFEDRENHRSSIGCPLVRRTTGGGAILHDREITYSLCIPSSNHWSKSNEQIYFMVHQIIVELLAENGVVAELFDGSSDEHNSDAFLCFQRRTRGDVILKGFKICGSAQRRKKNALIQHGSMLIAGSDRAPELPGIQDLCPQHRIGKADLIDRLGSQLGSQLGVDLSIGEMDNNELLIAENANKHVYAIDDWNRKR